MDALNYFTLKRIDFMDNLHPHLANKAKFLFFKPPNLRPPSSSDLETKSYPNRRLIMLPF